jgi:glycosyltransferase involved in cell wall biosynthesis
VFFSVVIPVYNRDSFLKNALESVFLQSYKNFEVIVVDDGSTIDLFKVLRPYISKNLTYIKIPENRGVSFARNVGIENSKYEFIAFLDSDDIWLPNKLHLQKNFLEQFNLLICHTDEFWFKNGRFVNQGKKHSKYGGRIFSKMLDFCRISPSSVVIHKDIFNEVGMFDINLPVCEDYDLWLRIALRFEIGYLPIKTIIKVAHKSFQLSLDTPFIEYYRLLSLCKILKNNFLFHSEKKDAIIEIERKFEIVSKGVNKVL